jgi:hypothetical protein
MFGQAMVKERRWKTPIPTITRVEARISSLGLYVKIPRAWGPILLPSIKIHHRGEYQAQDHCPGIGRSNFLMKSPGQNSLPRMPVIYSIQEDNAESFIMGKSHRNLFVSAVVSGIVLVLGLPGLADIISLAWETARPSLEQVVPSGLLSILSLISLGLFFAISYLNWEIYLKGAKKGKKGLVLVLSGVITGMLTGTVILAIIGWFLV